MESTIQAITPGSGPPSPRGRAVFPQGPSDSYAGSVGAAPVDPPEVPRRRTLHKVVAGSLLGLSVLGLAGATGVRMLANAPICADSSVKIGWEDGLCVSPEMGTNAGTLWRYLQSVPHLPSTIDRIGSADNAVYHPSGDQPPPRPLMQDGQLRVVSWNLHHGLGRDAEGARPQLDRMIQQMRLDQGDVYLLQEVAPQDAAEIVDALGMPGYFSATSQVQGNLLLVHPDLTVTDQQHEFLTGEPDGIWGSLGEFKEWALAGGGAEELRSLQTVEVRLPDGRTTLLWNTHFLTRTYTPEQRLEANQRLLAELGRQAEPGQIVVGGGDLNSQMEDSLPQALRAAGHDPHAHNIDFVVTRGVDGVELEGAKLYLPDGSQLSDHPRVIAHVPVQVRHEGRGGEAGLGDDVR
ncbi:MAG: endonuclease/exonuclease/phosphatase family protein [Candidatus Eremiobacterota bacterium]